jgi:cytochrome c oxidase assembly protein subunit 15
VPRWRAYGACHADRLVNVHHSDPPASTPGLALFAKLVVLLTFLPIFVGAHTTTAGAGMAFPDWPLSNGSLNPAGWWTNLMMRLEHGHRLTAGVVASCVVVLFVWSWLERRRVPRGTIALALAALVGILTQAVLGGLRVILDPQGIAATTSNTAMVFRVLHGCVAQVELCLLVAFAALVSPVRMRLVANPALRRVGRLGWITGACVFLQLLVGATMRHLGAGLAIPTFPRAMPDGGWMPKVHNAFIDLNFTHTRFGALAVTVLVLVFAVRVLCDADGDRLIAGPALLLFVLLAAQLTLGVFVIWQLRPAILTTLHVVNGAALLAATVLLNLRINYSAARSGNGSMKAKRIDIPEVAV